MRVTREDLLQRWVPIIGAQAVGLACGVAGIRLISRWVAPADYGVYGVFVTLAPVGATVVFAGLVKFVSRHWRASEAKPQLVAELLRAGVTKAGLVVVLCVVATLVIRPPHERAYGLWLAVSACLLAGQQLAQSALQASREHWRDFAISAATAVTRSFGPPLLYAATGAGLVALLTGFAGYALVGAVLGALVLRPWWPAGRPAPGATPVLTAVYDGEQFILLAAAAWVLTGLNRWVVAWRFGPEVAGYFTLGANVGGILPTILGAVLLQFFQPVWFARPVASAVERRAVLRAVDRVAIAYTLLAIGSAVALQAAMPVLVGTLVDQRFAAAAPFVLATGCSATALMVGTYYHAALIAVRRERACNAADLGGAVVLVVGAVASASAGIEWFTRWLLVSPLVPWVVNRTLAGRGAAQP